MKKTPREMMKEYQPKKPSLFYALLFRFLLFFVVIGKGARYTYEFNKKEMKKRQVIILADHACRDNFYYVIHGYKWQHPNVVMGYQNFFSKSLFKLFLHCQAIPKYLYHPDSRATKSILKLLKAGCSIMIFPEGIQSTHGATHPMNPATMKLIKKSGLDVVLCQSRGAYLSRPRYTSKYHKGKMYFNYKMLYTKDEIASMSEDELYEKYRQEIEYNDFIWNQEKRIAYKGKESNASGIDKILYVCPKCNSEFELTVQNDTIKCNHCGNEIKVNEYYDLIPQNDSKSFDRIDEWYNYQRKLVREEVKDPSYEISFDVNLYELNQEKLSSERYFKNGTGRLTINHQGSYYKGIRAGNEFEILLDIKSTPSAPFTPGKTIDYFVGEDLYSFEPLDNKLKVVKYMLIVEEIHLLYDPAWKKTSDDVYKI